MAHGTKKRETNISVIYLKNTGHPHVKPVLLNIYAPVKKKGGREIDRSEFAEAVEENAERYKNNKDLYRKRQEINEHIFGTIKRKWGYNHTNLKSLLKVNGEMALIILVYNIKRCINILSLPDLIAKLKKWQPNYDGIVRFIVKTTYFKPIYRMIILQMKLSSQKTVPVN